jgi:hypothetical protein
MFYCSVARYTAGESRVGGCHINGGFDDHNRFQVSGVRCQAKRLGLRNERWGLRVKGSGTAGPDERFALRAQRLRSGSWSLEDKRKGLSAMDLGLSNEAQLKTENRF